MRWWKLKQLKSKAPETRLQALEELAEENPHANADAFLDALKDSDPGIRKAAAEALGGMQEDRAVKPLLAALKDSVADVRASAADALKDIGDDAAIEPLLLLLKDSEAAVRWHAAFALENLGWHPENDSLRALHTVALGKIDHAAILGGAAVEPLLLVLKSTTNYKRQQAITALSKIHDSRVVKPLVGMLKDQDSNVRTSAVEALGKVGDARAVEPLVAALKDKDSRVRAEAIEALSKIGDASAIPSVVQLLKDFSWDVRIAAVQSLGKFKDPAIMEPLVSCLQDADADIRQAAVIALGKIGDTRAVQELAIALTDIEDSIRQTAAGVLRRIDSDWEHSPGARQAIPALQRAAKSSEYWVRQAAVDVLAKVGEKTVTAGTTGLIAATDQSAVKRQATINALLAVLPHSDRDLRQAAAEALGRLNDPRAIEPLVKSLEDRDEWVRQSAAAALDALHWQPADAREQASQLVILQRWPEAIKLGAAAVPPLIAALRATNSQVRRAAAEALGQLGDPRAAEPLSNCLRDKFAPVCHAVAVALRALNWQAANPALQAVQLIQLGEWEAAAALGAAAVEPLAAVSRHRLEDPGRAEAATRALEQITDPSAVGKLVVYAYNGDLALAIFTALERILSRQPDAVPVENLHAVQTMNNTRRNLYSVDPQTGVPAPAGVEEMDCSPLRQMAQAELARRGVKKAI